MQPTYADYLAAKTSDEDKLKFVTLLRSLVINYQDGIITEDDFCESLILGWTDR